MSYSLTGVQLSNKHLHERIDSHEGFFDSQFDCTKNPNTNKTIIR